MKCASCDIELGDRVTIARGEPFCCIGCAERGPCVCSYGRRRDGDAPRLVRVERAFLRNLFQRYSEPPESD